MNMYLVAAFVLLLVMLFLILRPFLLVTVEPGAEGAVDLTDPGAKARSVATVERVARAPKAPSATTASEQVVTTSIATEEVAAESATTEPVATVAAAVSATSTDDVRASVEAAIAARKAALKTRHCTACEAVVETGDAFCRACGTKVTA